MADPVDGAPRPDKVVLSLPAARTSLPLARAVVGAVAADAGATIDVIDDARQVVTEAVALVLGDSEPTAEVDVELEATDGGVVIDVRGAGSPVPPESFAWLLIDELSAEATVDVRDGVLQVRARVGGSRR